MKKLYLISAFLLGSIFFGGLAYGAVSQPLLPSGGGTGISSTTAPDVGNCLKVLDDSPFTYELGTCGSGGGGTAGTWSTTTSQTSSLINYPNNASDIVVIGSTATTSGEFYFDPNTQEAFFLNIADFTTTSSTILTDFQVNGGATTTGLSYLLSGLISSASSTFSSTFNLPSLSDGNLVVYGGTVLSNASTTYTSPLSYGAGAVTLDTSGAWTGNAGTATALFANGGNCSAGSYPLGVDALGAVEDCTVAGTGGVPFAWTPTVFGVATTTGLEFQAGFMSTGSSTVNGDFFVNSGATTTGIGYFLEGLISSASSTVLGDFTISEAGNLILSSTTPNALGEFGYNTATSSSLMLSRDTDTAVWYNERDATTAYASSTLSYDGGYGTVGTTTYLLGNYRHPITLVALYCKTDNAGTALIEIGTGTASSTVRASSSGVESLTNVSFTGRQDYLISIGSQLSTPNIITCTDTIRPETDGS